jgi:hypothetical protein
MKVGNREISFCIKIFSARLFLNYTRMYIHMYVYMYICVHMYIHLYVCKPSILLNDALQCMYNDIKPCRDCNPLSFLEVVALTTYIIPHRQSYLLDLE